jgi:hypothetical protein
MISDTGECYTYFRKCVMKNNKSIIRREFLKTELIGGAVLVVSSLKKIFTLSDLDDTFKANR